MTVLKRSARSPMRFDVKFNRPSRDSAGRPSASFRYSNRSALGIEDQERAGRALEGISGKRLTYQC